MKNQQKIKQEKKERRHRRVRAKIKGTNERPRFSVFRSNKQIYVQLVDDTKGRALVAADSQKIKIQNTNKKKKKKDEKKNQLGGKMTEAYEVGKLIAQKALKKKIEQVVFDRGGYKYHGRVKAVADGAREGGLKF
ncbi:50S ribosomal protein L18 [Candidatus Kuenenbacteria bacterium]|nr:50S ribosomal protein L18 [Candidatus Kuenenbacteria bacterium]